VSNVLKIESTKAKASFSKLPQQAKSKDIEITKHGEPQGYYLAPSEYRRLKALDRAGKTSLDSLEQRFRTVVQSMQTPAHRDAVKKIVKAPLTEIVRASRSVSASKIVDLGRSGPFGGRDEKASVVKMKKRRR
jgi:PHD/YefM family antitoxin component YafN of YafNO toxin-antitoxin module